MASKTRPPKQAPALHSQIGDTYGSRHVGCTVEGRGHAHGSRQEPSEAGASHAVATATTACTCLGLLTGLPACHDGEGTSGPVYPLRTLTALNLLLNLYIIILIIIHF